MDYISATKNWIKDFIIELNLCPFAKKPFDENRIRYTTYKGEDVEALTLKLIQELKNLTATPPEKVETTLIIFPNCLSIFLDYVDYLNFANDLLHDMQLEGVIQIASFHPLYQFANTQPNEASNYTNRSPYPMLHLLREESVEWAVNTYDTEVIPEKNIEKMEALGLEKILKITKK